MVLRVWIWWGKEREDGGIRIFYGLRLFGGVWGFGWSIERYGGDEVGGLGV